MKNPLHPVLSVILKRKKESSRPLLRNDSFKLGLVIEGGGMRGAISAGMAAGLEYLDLRSVFDAVYGASAGAMVGAYFISGQSVYSTSVYCDDISNRDFVKSALGIAISLMTHKPAMNLDFLLDILRNKKPLNWERIIDSPIKLNMIASSISKQKSVVLNNFESKEDIFKAFKASSTFPFIGGPPIEINNELYWDASLYESIPIKTAIDDRCTHIFVLRTRPDGVLLKERSFIHKLFLSRRFDKIKKGLRQDFLQTPSRYATTIRKIDEAESNPDTFPFIYSIKLPKETTVVRLNEIRRAKLAEGIAQGVKAVMSTFAKQESFVYEVPYPFSSSGYKINLGE